MFIQFVKAYYEWMEESGQTINLARNITDYRDIDSTLDQYITHFQNEYLYGLPLYVQGDKRYLVKHVLDVYRSKGTIEGYKLLFRLLYNEDIEIYVPKNDILKTSDGTWVKQKYLEVTYTSNINSLENKLIAGAFSGATAVAENVVKRNINGRFINIIYISNISGDFLLNEPLIPASLYENQASINLNNYPYIVGSVNSVNIIDGGQNFAVGDIINSTVSLGTGARFRVLTVGPKRGITFTLRTPGYGFTANATRIITRTGTEPYQGTNAQFTYSLINQSPVTYSTQIIAGFDTITIDSASYGMYGNSAANVNNAINNAIIYVTTQAGQLSTVLTSNGGVDYISNPYTTVRDLIDGRYVNGTISFSNTSTIVTGTGNNFNTYFANGSFVKIVGGYNANTDTKYDYRIVRDVANGTYMTLDDYPSVNSNTAGKARLAVPLWRASFLTEETLDINGGIKGEDEYVESTAGMGNGSVFTADVLTGGLGYNAGEAISAAKAQAVTNIYIRSGGTGYTNGDVLVFVGGGTTAIANGHVNTYSNGTISSVSIDGEGSGYQTTPVVKVQSTTGSGATLYGQIGVSNSSVIQAQVLKSAVGYEEGYWTTTRGFLNSDKYIQDSYYYQDYSYAIKSSIDFTAYADIMKKVFHIAGNEFFGETYIVDEQDSPTSEGEITITY